MAQDVLESPPLESANGKGSGGCISYYCVQIIMRSQRGNAPDWLQARPFRPGYPSGNAPEVRNKVSLTKIDAAMPRDVLVVKCPAEDTDATGGSTDESSARESRERSLGARGEIQSSGQARGSQAFTSSCMVGGRKKYCRHRRMVRKVKWIKYSRNTPKKQLENEYTKHLVPFYLIYTYLNLRLVPFPWQ